MLETEYGGFVRFCAKPPLHFFFHYEEKNDA